MKLSGNLLVVQWIVSSTSKILEYVRTIHYENDYTNVKKDEVLRNQIGKKIFRD